MRRNSFDEEKRRREREAVVRGREPHLDVRSLSDKLRTGEIRRERVVLAALLGNETAAVASGVRPNPVLSAGFARDRVGWLRSLVVTHPNNINTLMLVGYSSFAAFDLMERPGFHAPDETEHRRLFEPLRNAFDETFSITAAIRGVVQNAMNGESPIRPVSRTRSRTSAVRAIGDRVNELWDEARWLQESGDLEESGLDALWDVTSDLYVLVSVLRSRSLEAALRMTSNLLENAAAIWARGDRPNEKDWAEVSERVIARMILELLPELGRRLG